MNIIQPCQDSLKKSVGFVWFKNQTNKTKQNKPLTLYLLLQTGEGEYFCSLRSL